MQYKCLIVYFSFVVLFSCCCLVFMDEINNNE